MPCRRRPSAAIEGSNGLALDITGAAHLMDREEALCDDLRAWLEAVALSPRLARVGLRRVEGLLAR